MINTDHRGAANLTAATATRWGRGRQPNQGMQSWSEIHTSPLQESKTGTPAKDLLGQVHAKPTAASHRASISFFVRLMTAPAEATGKAK